MADRIPDQMTLIDDVVHFTINGCTLPSHKVRFAPRAKIEALEQVMRQAHYEGCRYVELRGSITPPSPDRRLYVPFD
jgi:hypothetical protein